MSDDPFDMPDVAGPSDRGRGGADPDRPAGRRWLWLLAGLVLGAAAALLVPHYLAPYLPGPFGGDQLRVEGPVLAERLEGERLMLTVETEQGAMLATFREKTSEIALLVDEGDTVTLELRAYRPFVEEPTLVGVYKGRAPAAAERADTAGEAATTPDTLSQPDPAPAAADTAEDEATDATEAETDTTAG